MERFDMWVACALVMPLALLDVACTDGGEGAVVDAGFNCELDDRGESLTVGLRRTGAEGFEFVLADFVPSPPAKGDNAWRVTAVDADGAAVPASSFGVRLIMPDHMHGTPIVPVVTAVGEDVAELAPLNLWMPGLWDVTVEARDDSAVLDEVTFRVCIDG